MPNFHNLEMRWGTAGAYHFLLELEKAAKIKSWAVAAVDCETRLANAIHAQDNPQHSHLMAA